MRKLVSSRRALGLGIVAVVVLGAGVAMAAPITSGGGAINQVRVVTETNGFTTASESFVNLPGAATTITAPSSGALLLMDFTSESVCLRVGGVAALDWCSVRILVDGVEAHPAAGSNFAFDSTDNGTTSPAFSESHSLDRTRRVGPGNHHIQVQVQAVDIGNNSNLQFGVDDWSLTVQRAA
jgi:hypothetical protein